jgi:hypothetical protein
VSVITSKSVGPYLDTKVYDEASLIRGNRKVWKNDFAGTSLNPDRWETVQLGAGHTISVANGELIIATGTTVNSETIIRSKEIFTLPLRSLFGWLISQKIANQEFYLELISVDPNTGQPDGLNNASFRIAYADNSGTSYANYIVQASGIAQMVSSATNFVSVQTGYSVYEIEALLDECNFYTRTIDSTSGKNASATRHQNIPNPEAFYKVQIRAKNLATAPATSTNLKFQFVTVVDHEEVTARVIGGRGSSHSGQGVPVTVTNSVGISGNPAVVGNVAHDSPISGAPIRIGGRALTANYTGVASGDVADFVTTVVGAQITKPFSIPELDWQNVLSPISTAVDTALKIAGAAGIRNYVTALQLINVGATATEVQLKDGATVIWRTFLPAGMTIPISFNFPTPLKGTAATVVNFTTVTAGCSVYVSGQGYMAP